jgi:hypothetical protein
VDCTRFILFDVGDHYWQCLLVVSLFISRHSFIMFFVLFRVLLLQLFLYFGLSHCWWTWCCPFLPSFMTLLSHFVSFLLTLFSCVSPSQCYYYYFPLLNVLLHLVLQLVCWFQQCSLSIFPPISESFFFIFWIMFCDVKFYFSLLNTLFLCLVLWLVCWWFLTMFIVYFFTIFKELLHFLGSILFPSSFVVSQCWLFL